jgi:hypothetical protein
VGITVDGVFFSHLTVRTRRVVIAAMSVSKFIADALTASRGAGFIIGIPVGWLVVCYLALSLGWRRSYRKRNLHHSHAVGLPTGDFIK